MPTLSLSAKAELHETKFAFTHLIFIMMGMHCSVHMPLVLNSGDTRT